MLPSPYKKIPLTADEKALLLYTFRKRRRFNLIAFGVMLVAAFIISGGIFLNPGMIGKKYKPDRTSVTTYTTIFEVISLRFAVLAIPIIGTGIYVYLKKIQPLKAEAVSGVKEKVPYVIVRKEYFPLTNQYYVALDDPNYLHHEIDGDTFQSCVEGGTIYIYRGVKSKFVFEESGRFTII